MKFTVLSDELSKKIKCFTVIPSSGIIPVLDNILVTVDGGVKMRASDLETDVDVDINVASTEGSGSFLVDIKSITTLVNELKGETLVITVDDKMTITTDSGVYELPILSSEDFPMRVAEGNTSFIGMKESVLLAAIDAVLFATANDELRPVMEGVFFDADTMLSVVGTDAHVLSRYTTEEFTGKASFILPKKTAAIIKGIAKNTDEPVAIQVGNKNATIAIGGYSISTRLIEGKYPNYASVIPTNNGNTFKAWKDAFFKSVKRAGLMSNKSSGLVKVQIDKTTLIQASDIDFNKKGTEKINAEVIGECCTIGLNKDRLLLVLGALTGDTVEMTYSTPDRAVLFNNGNVNILLMPMLLN